MCPGDMLVIRRREPHYPGKIDYSQELPDTRWIERIALLNEYVKHDDGADGRELCWIVHVEGEVCRRLEGHDEVSNR